MSMLLIVFGIMTSNFTLLGRRRGRRFHTRHHYSYPHYYGRRRYHNDGRWAAFAIPALIGTAAAAAATASDARKRRRGYGDYDEIYIDDYAEPYWY